VISSSGRGSPRVRAIVIALLIAIETVYFGSRCAAGFARLIGERAYFTGNSVKAWSLYNRAAALGSDPVQIMTDKAEVLLFGLDQQNVGAKIELPIEADEIRGVARGIVSSLLASAPYRAYFWSLATDVHTHEALSLRRATPLDLSTLSDDPLENLLPQEGMAVAALREAARREPRNYIYDDLLAEQFSQWGLAELAVPHVRRAVALYPLLEGHIYLSRPRLEPEIVDAAVAGFGDALRINSMISDDAIECDAGRFLAGQGRHEEALVHLRRALEMNPSNPGALYRHGISSHSLGDYASAMDYLSRAAEALPESASLWYYLGQARLKAGRNEDAIKALRRARELDPRQVRFFNALAEALEGDGAIKEAERQFQAAASLNPGDASAWLALLRFYERHPDLGSAARQACARLRRSRVPEDVYKTLCEVLARKGQ